MFWWVSGKITTQPATESDSERQYPNIKSASGTAMTRASASEQLPESVSEIPRFTALSGTQQNDPCAALRGLSLCSRADTSTRFTASPTTLADG